MRTDRQADSQLLKCTPAGRAQVNLISTIVRGGGGSSGGYPIYLSGTVSAF